MSLLNNNNKKKKNNKGGAQSTKTGFNAPKLKTNSKGVTKQTRLTGGSQRGS